MAKKAKSLLQWCHDNQMISLLSELDNEQLSKHYAQGYIPDRISYNSPDKLSWKCEKGHKWECELVGRTLFGLMCPDCHPDQAILPVGTKYGCLTIIENNGSDITAREKEHNSDVQKYWGKPNYFTKIYKCKCKCGKIYYMNQTSFLASRHKYCTEGYKEPRYRWLQTEEEKQEQLKHLCGLAVEAERKKIAAYRRVFDKNYDIDFTGRIFESLEILECVNDRYERLTSIGDRRKKGTGIFTVYKLYKCRCYLCGKEQLIRCSDFHIDPPTAYGYTAYNGFWSDAECDCHKISSFQWIVNKILFENEIPYRVEYEFDDLYGYAGVKKLRFDFAIFNPDSSIKCLIECQGEGHSKPVKEFGGKHALVQQQRNDDLKRQYVKKHNIPLIEISYQDKNYDSIYKLLSSHGILNND